MFKTASKNTKLALNRYVVIGWNYARKFLWNYFYVWGTYKANNSNHNIGKYKSSLISDCQFFIFYIDTDKFSTSGMTNHRT